MITDTQTLWLAILALAAVTVATRGAFLVFLHRVNLPAGLQHHLRFIPPAIFAALVAPELLMTGGSLNVGLDNHKLVGGAAAALVAWRSRNAFLTIVAGMLVLHTAQWVLSR
jgi:branched-subunit amino acid transport protein